MLILDRDDGLLDDQVLPETEGLAQEGFPGIAYLHEAVDLRDDGL